MSAAKFNLKKRWVQESLQSDAASIVDTTPMPVLSEPTPYNDSSYAESPPQLSSQKMDEGGETSKTSDQSSESLIKSPIASIPPPPSISLKQPKFSPILENIYVDGNNRKSKDAKAMLCECSTSEEERSEGTVACGEDCINRHLWMECGSRCPCGEFCTNRRFQNQQYAKVEPFPAGQKGFGLRTLEDLEAGQFIIEYVGEVLDVERFYRRTRRYGRNSEHKHHYFMALKNGEVIDATEKGNISRFINHSCDPNSETQKWTVKGQQRIGFFTKKAVKAFEEITFDYKFERYGREAQPCYCGTTKCTGFIGGQQLKEDEERSKVDEREYKNKEKRRKEQLEDRKMTEQMDRLLSIGCLRNKDHVLSLNRLMVLGPDFESKIKLLDLLMKSEENCLRVFLELHGCQLIWSWMIDDENISNLEHRQLRIKLLQVLRNLPIQHKNMIEDSKILFVVNRWSKPLKPLKFPYRDVDPEISSVVYYLVEKVSSFDSSLSGDETPSSSSASVASDAPVPRWDIDCDESKLDHEVQRLALELLNKWSDLKENFKIPKKNESGNIVTERVWKIDKKKDVKDEMRRSSLLEKREEKPSSGVRYNEIYGRTKAGTDTKKRSRSRSKSPKRRSLVSQRSGRSPEPKRRRESRFDKRSPYYGNRTRSPSSSVSGANSEHVMSTEDRRKIFEASASAQTLDNEVRMRIAEFEMDYMEALEQSGSTDTTPPGRVPPPVAQQPIPVPGQETLINSQLSNGSKPAILVYDPNSENYWWQEQASLTLVYPATEQQLANVQMGDWSKTPYFEFDGELGIIRELQMQLALPPAPVPPVLSHGHPSALLPLPVVGTSQPLPNVLPSDAVSSTDQQIAFLEKQLEDLKKAKEIQKRADINVEEVDMDVSDNESERDDAVSSTDQDQSTLSLSKEPATNLPLDWSFAKDSEGNIYYFNTKTRETQWEPPEPLPPSKPGSSSKLTGKSKSKTTTAAADTSSEVTKKGRERFKTEISKYVIKCLSHFKNRFSNDEDFKHLARKLSHGVMEKEVKGGSSDELKVTDLVKKKAKGYIKVYMKEKVGTVYKRERKSI